MKLKKTLTGALLAIYCSTSFLWAGQIELLSGKIKLNPADTYAVPLELSFTYDANNRVKQTDANAIVDDVIFQLLGGAIPVGTKVLLGKYEYEYDAGGNISDFTVWGTNNIGDALFLYSKESFTYNALGLVATKTEYYEDLQNPGEFKKNVMWEYEYDTYGNLLGYTYSGYVNDAWIYDHKEEMVIDAGDGTIWTSNRSLYENDNWNVTSSKYLKVTLNAENLIGEKITYEDAARTRPLNKYEYKYDADGKVISLKYYQYDDTKQDLVLMYKTDIFVVPEELGLPQLLHDAFMGEYGKFNFITWYDADGNVYSETGYRISFTTNPDGSFKSGVITYINKDEENDISETIGEGDFTYDEPCNCTPDPQCTDLYCPTSIPEMTVGTAVSHTITLNVPEQYTYSEMTVNLVKIALPETIANVPAGLNWCVSATELLPDNSYCAYLWGTPEQADTYTITMDLEITVNTIFGNIAIPYPVEFTFTVHNAGTDIGNIHSDETGIYPNPATDVVHVKGDVSSVTVYTINGTLLYQGTGKNIDVSSFPAGVYPVKLTTDSGTVVHRLIKR